MLLKDKLEKYFVILAMFFGLLYVFITPPFQSVDEPNHFYRAYSIAQGDFISIKQGNYTGGYIPEEIRTFENNFSYMYQNTFAKIKPQEIIKSMEIEKVNSKKIFVPFSNTALYSPIPYTIQAITIVFFNKITPNPAVLFYLVRIINLFLYCFLGYLAIKNMPFFKITTFLLLLIPMNLSLGASCSTDVTLIGTSMIFTAEILKAMKNTIKTKNLLSLGILAFILAMTKHNLFLIPLLFLIPKRNFGNKYAIKISSLILVSLIPCILWSKLIKNLYVPLNDKANMYDQINYIILHPLQYIMVLLRTLLFKTLRIIATSIGFLGWQDTRLWFMTYILYPFAIFISLITGNIKEKIFTKNQEIFITTVLIISYILIVTYMYLSWSAVGNNIVIGLNGKYFMPIALIFFVLFGQQLVKYQIVITKKIENYFIIFTAFILLSSVLSIIDRFYL